MEKYEKVGKIGRPVRNNNQTLNVEFGLSLFQLLDLDETDQLFTVNVWNKFVSFINDGPLQESLEHSGEDIGLTVSSFQTWRDEILTWNPKDYNGVKNVRIPVKHVWTPDIILHN